MELKKTNQEGLKIGVKSDGRTYSVREDRRRYFFPDEWTNFISLVKKKKHKFFFYTLLFTGARIMEVLHIKHEDIDIERGTVTLKVVKRRTAKKNFTTGKSRGFFVCSNFIKEYKSFIRGDKINQKDYIFLNNSKLPPNYEELRNEDKKKYYISKVISYSYMVKRIMKKTGIEDYYNFSPHNFRKTYGMWVRNFLKDSGELCYRMGHDIDTYVKHYGSSLIFTDSEIRKIEKIMGEIK